MRKLWTGSTGSDVGAGGRARPPGRELRLSRPRRALAGGMAMLLGAALAAPLLTTTSAQAAPVGQGFTLNASDLGIIGKLPTDEVVRCEECNRILVRTGESGL